MSADKYLGIFLCQIEANLFINYPTSLPLDPYPLPWTTAWRACIYNQLQLSKTWKVFLGRSAWIFWGIEKGRVKECGSGKVRCLHICSIYSQTIHLFNCCPWGYSLKFLVGGCCPLLQVQTQFQTKKCYFPHPFSDLASKIHTVFRPYPLEWHISIYLI